MLAEKFIALDQHLTADGAFESSTMVIGDDTFVVWRGVLSCGPVEIALQLSPTFDSLGVTIYDAEIEEVLWSGETQTCVTLSWIKEQLSTGSEIVDAIVLARSINAAAV